MKRRQSPSFQGADGRMAAVKRKWTEMDWEVAMEAQSFVAVFAEAAAEEEAPKKSEKKGKVKAKAKGKRGLRRRKKGDDDEEEVEERKEQEEKVEEKKSGDDDEGFWLAELRDDVTEEMLDADVSVHVRWLNKRSGTRYEYAFDDMIDVQTILCHVYMRELDDESLELTDKSLARVRRCVKRTRGELTEEEDVDMEDDEKPPTSRRKKRASVRHDGDDGEGRKSKRHRASGGGRATGGAKKLSKREEAMHIPPKYASVDASKYDDVEIRGKHAFKPSKDDVMATSREVLRAVVTKNHKVLKKLTEDKAVCKTIYTFSMQHSADVKKTPLQYAIEADDLTAAGLLLQARKLEKKLLAKKPEMSLPSHSTGKHTSAFSDYNRRAINASRGGREGNNALMEDKDGCIADDEDSFLWECNKTSVKMLTLFFPTGEWSNYGVAYNVAKACRAGNYKLAYKLIETLSRNGGWGFNDLHCKVLSDSDEALPVFRSVSAIKQAYQTKIRPLHLAAINPNTKYLEALWDSVGDEWSAAKDDLAFEPIHFAAACKSTAPLAFLLERKCNVFARTKRRQTPIMRAIATCREDNAIFIMDKVAEQDPELVSKVVSERGPGSFQPIHYAARYGCARVLEHLLKNGADINSVCEGKLTPLCLAAREGHYDCVKTLLDHGAKVNMGDKLKKTPLIFAVKNGHTRIAAMLINNGANVNAFDTSENSVVHYAASYGWKSCLELLVDTGADFWAKNSWGFVPLTCALLKQRLLCSEFILERDPNHLFLDFRDRQGCTMLFLQCNHSKNVSQIKYLLDKGLNPNIPNSENVYPLQVLLQRAEPKDAVAAGDDEEEASFYYDAIRLLLENKASPHYDVEVKKPVPGLKEKPIEVLQPLQIAIKRKLKDEFLLLLNEYDADPSKQGSDGLDAWMTAVWMGTPGEFFLEALFKHHHEKKKTKKLDFASVDVYGDNIFHCVGWNTLNHILSPTLVRELVKKCNNPAQLFNQKNGTGLTPLQLLLSHERDRPTKDLSLPEHVDLLEEAKRADERYSEIVEIFAQYATTEDSWIRFVDEEKAKLDTVDDDDESQRVRQSDDSDNDSDDEDEDEDEDENDDEDDDEEEDEDENDGDDAAKTKKKQVTRELPKKEHSNLVKYSSILHAAANRTLQPHVKTLNEKWFGSNLMTLLLKKIQFSTEVINFADYKNSKTPLHYAVERGDAEGVGALLKSKADPNHSPIKCGACVKDNIPCSCPRDLVEVALVVAVRNNDLDVTRLLLQSKRADVGCFEKDTLNRPLHLALSANNAAITAILLEHKADLSRLNSAGSSPLHLAVQARHSVIAKQPHEGEVVYTNLEPTSDINQGALSAISEALKSDQAKHAVMSYDGKKRTPTHLAAANRDLELLRALVGASANKKLCVNKTDQFGRTPLHFAVNASSMSPDASFEVERFLLQSGADPNVLDSFGYSVLHYALFKIDMDWHFRYDSGKDKTTAAREREEGTYESKKRDAFLEVLRAIPSNETDPVETVSNLTSVPRINTGAQDILGRTPLHLAAATGAFVCASALLAVHSSTKEKEAALSVTDKANFTPLGRAVEYLRQTTILTLLQNGADVNGHVMVADDEDDDEDAKTRIITRSYFYHAVKHSLTGVCHILLNAKFSKRQAVEDALLCGQFQLASNLMVSIEVSSDSALLAQENASGDTLLHSLAQVKKPFDDLAKHIAWNLVDAGLAANKQNVDGCTPLHFAAMNGNIHLMDFLIHNSCDINHKNKSGETPLIFAVKRSKLGPKAMIQVLQYFTDLAGLDIHAKDTSGVNVLAAILDRFVGSTGVKSEVLFEWLVKLLKKGVDSNGLFSSCTRKDFFKNDLFGVSTEVQMPPVIRVAYAKTTSLRCTLLGLLLRYGAKVTGADSNGNSLLMHLASNNMVSELHIALGKTKTMLDPVDPKSTKLHTIHVSAQDIKAAVSQANKIGQSVLHIAIKPFKFGSHENVELLELLVSSGASLQARDKEKRTPVDYTLGQESRFLYRYLRDKYPKIVTKDVHEVFDDAMEEWENCPDYTADANAYITECESNGKITKARVHPEPSKHCDVGALKRVYGKLDASNKVISGEEYDALLTKVDVKNGRFGLNVFYRCQIVHDEIQGIYVVFTNWGRIGEEGKFQNTPFHSPDDAVNEFKKIFKSKTGNHWEERHAFVKHSGKYNLVQRVNFHTKLSEEITQPFVEVANKNPTSFVPSKRNFGRSVEEMLFAITDVRNLQLAASESANSEGSLPLANTDELRAAVNRLVDIRTLIEARDKLTEEMQKVQGDMSDSASSQLADLSQQHSAYTEQVSEKSSRYYEVMPCNEDAFGSSIKAFNTVNDVNVEINRLRQLIDITHTYKMLLGAKRFQTSIHPLDYCYSALQVNISPIGQDTDEAKLLTRWFFNGLRSCDQSSYRISNIFQISRNGEKNRFMQTLEARPALNSKHTQLLWHGTRRTNLMGILSQGLRIAPPEAPHHGYMYGKGLYFANVAAKSLAYCDAAYQIASKSKDPDGNDVEKKREVHYLLACQVALGCPKELSGSVEYGKQVESVDSVRALGQLMPDPSGVVVSPISGAALPLGKVGQLGVAFPYDTVWAKTECSPMPWSWYERNPKCTPETQELWSKIVDDLNEGQTYTVEDDKEKALFFQYKYEAKTITIDVVTKDTTLAGSATFYCDATLKIKVKQEDQTMFSWQAKRLRNAYKNSEVGDGFQLVTPERPEYDELIVYDEGQARIRYLVEVESL